MSVQAPINIQVLGGFSITIGSYSISDKNNRSKKPWMLLEYLIAFRDRELSQNELIELLWPEDDSDNPAGALKTLMFRVRKLLADLNYPDKDLIIQRRGTYAWNPDLHCTVDSDVFEQLCSQAHSEELEESERIQCYLDAIDLYKGDFLPKSSMEPWVIPLNTYYHTLYLRIVHEVTDLLFQAEHYDTIITICQQAMKIEAFDEALHYKLINALFKNGNSHGALEQYNTTMNQFLNQFGITPSDELKSLYKEITKTSKSVTTDISMIKEHLREESRLPGAFFCEYEFFKDIYRLECRAAERSGDSLFLCLFTLSSANGDIPVLKHLSHAMETLKYAIQFSLRRGDVFSRYSVSQYILILPTATYENAEMVMKRTATRFHKEYSRKDIFLSYSAQPLL